MSMITRSDGVQFVVQAYRELLTTSKKSLLAQEIRLLAEQQGQYIYLTRKDQGHYEAAFSNEMGYLLGESIWHYFSCPENLIFVEAIPDSAQLLVVVVRDSTIYLDGKVLASNLRAELVPLMTQKFSYRIITSGKVPLYEEPNNNGFTFPLELIESFEQLTEPLFPELPLNVELRLQPLAFVLKSQHLQSRYVLPLVIVLIIVLGAIGSWWWFAERTPVVAKKIVATPKSSPFLAYYRALSTPAPTQQLELIAKLIENFYLLPGWQASNISMRNQQVSLDLLPIGGELPFLLKWIKQNHYQYQFRATGVTVMSPVQLPERLRPQTIQPLSPQLAKLLTRLDKVLVTKSIRLGNVIQQQSAKEIVLTVHLNDMTPSILNLIAQELQDMPIVLESVDFRINTGLVNGTMQLSLWGN